MKPMTLGEIAKIINAQVEGDSARLITGISNLQAAKAGDISFLDNPKYRSYLGSTKASAVILSAADRIHCPCDALVVNSPYFAYATIAHVFAPKITAAAGIHPTAVIGENCQIDETASIGAHVTLEDRVVIGKRTQIRAGSVIGQDARIGDDCLIWANVTIYYGVQIGHRVIVHSGAVIGADGFGFAPHEGQWHKIPQLGTVIIEDEVEIGASTTIDRGALEDTILSRGVKLDNQIQVGHNCQIGENTIVAGCSGLAGSTKIGKNCLLGARVGIAGHVEIADRVTLCAETTVMNSLKIPDKVYASGIGQLEYADWKKNMARFRSLDEYMRRLIALEKKVNEKETGENAHDK